MVSRREELDEVFGVITAVKLENGYAEVHLRLPEIPNVVWLIEEKRAPEFGALIGSRIALSLALDHETEDRPKAPRNRPPPTPIPSDGRRG